MCEIAKVSGTKAAYSKGGGKRYADQDNMAALKQHWTASASGDLETEHNIYDDNVLCEYPQSGERIHGRRNLQALRGHHPGNLPASACVALWVPKISGQRNTRSATRVSCSRPLALWSSKMAKVIQETQDFAEPFPAPADRRQWVEQASD